MASSTAFGTDPRNIALGDAVRRKRVQLDEEIEMFRALKEQEFRAFEERLRRGSGEVDVGRVEASLRGGRARIKVGKEKRERRGREREGEGEFEGVFTPRFLPLLGGERSLGDRSGFERVLFGKERGERLTDEGVETLRREEEERVKVERGWYDGGRREQRNEAKTKIAGARLGSQSLLSSSAEYRRSNMTSPLTTPARPLSSSVPPEHALDQRRSSSRSDASIDGLRSSLRSSREPRSPKRVQFSIDDTVVSPSTSPIATRNDESVLRNPKDPTRGAKGFERFEVLKGPRGGNTSGNGVRGRDSGGSEGIATLTTSNNADSPSGNNGQSFGSQPDTILASSAGAEEPFDILDNDEDVFEFDEDIEARGSRATKANDEEELIDDDVGEPEKGDGPSLSGSSPHAGSLPIEINWGASMRRGFKDDNPDG